MKHIKSILIGWQETNELCLSFNKESLVQMYSSNWTSVIINLLDVFVLNNLKLAFSNNNRLIKLICILIIEHYKIWETKDIFELIF